MAAYTEATRERSIRRRSFSADRVSSTRYEAIGNKAPLYFRQGDTFLSPSLCNSGEV
jgi:hypothetical protein